MRTNYYKPHRSFIETQILLELRGVAIYPDHVDLLGFRCANNAFKRSVARRRGRESQ